MLDHGRRRDDAPDRHQVEAGDDQQDEADADADREQHAHAQQRQQHGFNAPQQLADGVIALPVLNVLYEPDDHALVQRAQDPEQQRDQDRGRRRKRQIDDELDGVQDHRDTEQYAGLIAIDLPYARRDRAEADLLHTHDDPSFRCSLLG